MSYRRIQSNRSLLGLDHVFFCRDDRFADDVTQLTLHPQEQHLALESARQRQKTKEFQESYATRAGVEGTVSQAAFALDMRRTRYRGLAKTHLQHIATAVAINLRRYVDWSSDRPRSKTRISHFAALAA